MGCGASTQAVAPPEDPARKAEEQRRREAERKATAERAAEEEARLLGEARKKQRAAYAAQQQAQVAYPGTGAPSVPIAFAEKPKKRDWGPMPTSDPNEDGPLDLSNMDADADAIAAGLGGQKMQGWIKTFQGAKALSKGAGHQGTDDFLGAVSEISANGGMSLMNSAAANKIKGLAAQADFSNPWMEMLRNEVPGIANMVEPGATLGKDPALDAAVMGKAFSHFLQNDKELQQTVAGLRSSLAAGGAGEDDSMVWKLLEEIPKPMLGAIKEAADHTAYTSFLEQFVGPEVAARVKSKLEGSTDPETGKDKDKGKGKGEGEGKVPPSPVNISESRVCCSPCSPLLHAPSVQVNSATPHVIMFGVTI